MIATAAPTFVLPQPNDFWATVGIFPDALKQRDEAEVRERQVRDEAEVRERQVRKTLQKLGRGNLRLLCEEACIPRSPDAGSEELAGLLLSATPEHTLLHLREFMRGRIEVIEHVYESAFSAAQRTRFEAAIHQLSHEGEQIKVFTKLCLLY
ncbi:MAG TPA: hypothetical protein VIL46_13035, partial [Gemmataceae bacterium]